jgi:hypothetical protein
MVYLVCGFLSSSHSAGAAILRGYDLVNLCMAANMRRIRNTGQVIKIAHLPE